MAMCFRRWGCQLVDRSAELNILTLLLLGVGTVFGTLGVVLLLIVLEGLSSSSAHGSLESLFSWLLIYGSVGAVIAAMVCVLAAFPMVLLFRIIFFRLKLRGNGTRRSGVISAGCSSLIGTIGVVVAAVVSDFMSFPVMAWPAILIPTGIALLLARLLFSDQEETTLK
jgi:hypothetical protein